VRKIKTDEIELISILGADKLKSIGEQIVEIVRQHDLQKSPDTCKKLFNYLSDVIDGWNTGQEVKTMDHAREVLLDQLETLALRSENAHDRELAGISAAMVEIYDRLNGQNHEPCTIVGPKCGRDKNGTFRCVCGRCRELSENKGVIQRNDTI
jgi:hypothetical protein